MTHRIIQKVVLLSALSIWGIYFSPAQELPDLKLPLPADSTLMDVRTTNFPEMKKLYFTPIPGAPVLQQPFQVNGSLREIRTEEHGLAYPTIFDWNRDGKPDLLVGEFLTGESRIKVYLNVGSARKPKFTGEWFYATDVNGKVISNNQWCCIGIHPQIVDVNGDGYPDIISGQYNPGVITWWKGGEHGFDPGRQIPQLGYQEGKQFTTDEPCWSPEAMAYWNYSSARLADFNGDGLPDLFVAGSGGYRVALNVGTKEEPRFGRREFLFHVDGTILHTRRKPGIRIATGEDLDAVSACSRATHCYLNPVDWDGDGVLDIIATDEYIRPGELGVYFLRGVNTDDGLRFEPARPLFLVPDGSKALPGCSPHIQVVDYNHDGIPDIIMGLSIPTINGFEGATDIYWQWIKDLGLSSPGKDTGESLQYYKDMNELQEKLDKKTINKKFLIGKLDDWKYLTLRHRGFIFVFPGQKNRQKAIPIPMKAEVREFLYDKPAAKKPETKQTKSIPVQYFSQIYPQDGKLYLRIIFKTSGTYHLYSTNKINANQRPVSIETMLPEGFEKSGDMILPPVKLHGANEIYDGKLLHFIQEIKTATDLKGTFEIKVKLGWQTCSDESCLPPEEAEITLNVTLPLDS